jgi:hypothetical protein
VQKKKRNLQNANVSKRTISQVTRRITVGWFPKAARLARTFLQFLYIKTPVFESTTIKMQLLPVLLVVITLGTCSATLQACNSSIFCPSSAPFCLKYGTDYTLRAMRSEQATQQNLFVTNDMTADLSVDEGVCVQCLHDCDCGINQYCGIDPDVSDRASFPLMSLDTLPVISATKNFSKVAAFCITLSFVQI